MIRQHSTLNGLLIMIFSAFLLSSCGNKGEVPFPAEYERNAQPVTIPLKFSASKKIKWDTVGTNSIKPTLVRFNVDELPAIPYDSTGFRTLSAAPISKPLNINELPDSTFDIDALPSKKLSMRSSFRPPPVLTAVSKPALQKNKPLSIYDLGPSQDLPVRFITALMKDKKGFLWISSGEGFFRYKGDYLQTFVKGPLANPPAGMVEDDFGKIWYLTASQFGVIEPGKRMISSTPEFTAPINTITPLMKDGDGRIWVPLGTTSRILIIDPKTFTYKTLDSTNGLPKGQPKDMIVDSQKNIWIASTNGGVCVINTKTKKIKRLDRSNGLSSDFVSALGTDNNGHILLGVIYGMLDVIDPKANTIQHYSLQTGLQSGFTANITCDASGQIWMAKAQGVDVLNLAENTVRHIGQDDGLSGEFVSYCVPADSGSMWVGTISGLALIKQNASSAHPFKVPVVSLLEDSAKKLWVATQKGLFIMDQQKKVYRRFGVDNGLSHDFVQSFNRHEGKVYVATNNGYNEIDLSNKTLKKYTRKEGLPTGTVYNVFPDKSGSVWLVGPRGGVIVLDSANHLVKQVNAAGGLSDDNIQDFKQDEEGNIWLATNLAGVDILDPTTGMLKTLNSEPGLKDTCNRVLLNDAKGRMWIGTDRGIYIADTKNNTLTTITTREGLTDNRILALNEHNGQILAGTNKKITIITPPADSTKKWIIAPLQYSSGLSKVQNSWASDGITADGQYLWGDDDLTVIDKIKPESDSATTMISELFVLTKPLSFSEKPKPLLGDTVWFNNFPYTQDSLPTNTGYAFKDQYKFDSLEGTFNLPVNLHLDHDQNYLQFHFTQAKAGRLDEALYSYILVGIDRNWSIPNTNNYSENYLNLPHGKYTFKVRSTMPNGEWSAPAQFSFSILPPWYLSWWAYTIYALIGIALLRAYIVFRSRKLQRENAILEEKVNLRTAQLQRSLEDLKATQSQLIQSEKMASLGELTAGIAHEIQNPLNFMNNFSELNAELIDEMKAEMTAGDLESASEIADTVKQNLAKITHHGKRADAIVKGMLQHSRSSNGVTQPTDINALCDEYLRLSYHGLRAKDKSFNAKFETDFDENIRQINIVPQDIGRVLLNLINNAFYAVNEKKKQSMNGFDPTVSVNTKRMGNKVAITISDNGSGIPDAVKEKIFQPFFTTKPTGQGTGLGLSLSYDIVKAHGGELKAVSTLQQGTQMIVELPASAN